MGMSIEEAIKYYENKNVVLTEEEALANTIAIEIMRKYQKITEIVTKWHNDLSVKTSMAMTEIEEVLEDGNDD